MLTIRSFFILLSVQWPGFVSFFWLRFLKKNPCTHFTVCTLKRRSVWGTTSEKSFYQEQMSSNYRSYHMAFAYLPYTSHWTTCVWIVEGDFPFSPPSPCPPPHSPLPCSQLTWRGINGWRNVSAAAAAFCFCWVCVGVGLTVGTLKRNRIRHRIRMVCVLDSGWICCGFIISPCCYPVSQTQRCSQGKTTATDSTENQRWL